MAWTNNLLELLKAAIIDGQVLFPLLMALVAGFLTSMSPCIYPLIPITLSIMGVRKYDSHIQGFLVSLAYVAGMSAIYTLLGALFASIGVLAGSLMQEPVALIIIASFFTLMAFSMFGVFNLVLPDHLMTRLSQIGGQGLKGAFLMGLVAGLVAAPCTGPVLGFILTLIAGEKNIVFGSLLMLTFSVGMGSPFIVLGTFSSAISRLPKSGSWMDSIKFIFGAAMLGAAIYYLAFVLQNLRDLLNSLNRFGLVAILLILLVGILLLMSHGLFLLRGLLRRTQIAAGAIVSALAIAALLSFEITEPLSTEFTDGELTWHGIDAGVRDKSTFDRLLAQAKSQGRPVMVDFYADWCVACKQLEVTTYRDAKVSEKLKNFFLVKIDSSKSSDYLIELQNRFKVTGLPTVIFIDKNGNLVDDARVLGFMRPEQFLRELAKVK